MLCTGTTFTLRTILFQTEASCAPTGPLAVYNVEKKADGPFIHNLHMLKTSRGHRHNTGARDKTAPGQPGGEGVY